MHRDSFDRQMSTFQTIFWIMFAVIAVIIISVIALQIFIGVKLVQDPTGTAEKAGSILKTFLDSAGVGK